MNNKSIKAITISTLVLLILDFTFIYFIMASYGKMVANVQGSPLRFNIYGGFACYILIISSIYYFILRTRRPVKDAFLLGLFIYGILESTNYAILKKWDAIIAITDTIWGGVLYAGTTYITYQIMSP
jgi:uncharacterized membrane protein